VRSCSGGARSLAHENRRRQIGSNLDLTKPPAGDAGEGADTTIPVRPHTLRCARRHGTNGCAAACAPRSRAPRRAYAEV